MKNTVILTTATFLIGLAVTIPPAFGQGVLTPPGPPAPTMKSLDQIEPRTAVNATNTPGDASNLFIISQPGSYYLTTNITGAAGKIGITIAASGVTLDLMGFEMAGVPSSSVGVFVSGSRTNIAIRNGTVRSWGTAVNTSSANNGQYQDLRLSANTFHGLFCGQNSTVVNCTAQGNGNEGFVAGTGSTLNGCAAQANTGHGISAGDGSTLSGCSAVTNSLNGINAGNGSTVIGCTANINQQHGISVGFGSTVKDCSALSNVQDGIFTAFDCTVTSCTVRRNDMTGILASTGNTVSECTVAFNGFAGINVTSDCLVRHNNCRQNGRVSGVGPGIFAGDTNNRIDDNNVTGNAGSGITCASCCNIVIRNTARGNASGNYSIGPGNAKGQLLDVTGGATITNVSAWANFEY